MTTQMKYGLDRKGKRKKKKDAKHANLLQKVTSSFDVIIQ